MGTKGLFFSKQLILLKEIFLEEARRSKILYRLEKSEIFKKTIKKIHLGLPESTNIKNIIWKP